MLICEHTVLFLVNILNSLDEREGFVIMIGRTHVQVI